MAHKHTARDHYDLGYLIMNNFTDMWNTLRSIYESRHEPENMRPLAEWYWRTLLSFALFAIVLVLAFGVWEFYTVTKKLNAGDSLRPAEQPEVLTKKDLAGMLDAYGEREARFDTAKNTRPTVADPSR